MRYLFLDPRWNWMTFRSRLDEHRRRWAVLYLALVAAGAWFHAHYAFGLNASHSLPQTLFLVGKGVIPQRGEYVAFRWAGGGPYRAGATFVKVIAGIPGDVVSADGPDYYVSGTAVGRAKPVGRHGQLLLPGPTGKIPVGRYYVSAPHPDSLDSRYALTGWIAEPQIIGVAYALF